MENHIEQAADKACRKRDNRQLGLRPVNSEIDELKVDTLNQKTAEYRVEQTEQYKSCSGSVRFSGKAQNAGEDTENSGNRQQHMRCRNNVISFHTGCFAETEEEKKNAKRA